MDPFSYHSRPARVVFGFGTLASLASEADRMAIRRPLVIATPQQEDQALQLARGLTGLSPKVFSGATMHTPVTVTAEVMRVVREHRADGLIAIGGGSTIGLAKAIALRTDLPQIVVPTTYAGSEMTPILGETRDGIKKTLIDEKVLAEVVIYDVDLTYSLPTALSAVSGLNAIAHAVEALYARDTNPIISLLAADGIRALATALPNILTRPQDPRARSDALYGAWLCGTCLGNVGMALHHKLCHTLGAAFDLPHAEVHSVILPHAAAFNAIATPKAMATIATSLGCGNAPDGLYALARKLRVPGSLAELGMPEGGIEGAADLAMSNPYWNPRPLERDAIRGLLTRAYHGEPPVVGNLN